MEKPVKGDVVVLPFPFSDLSSSKRRPALVLADAGGSDLILCQITSDAKRDGDAISITTGDFSEGSLEIDSMARPNKLFTANRSLVLYRAGSLVEAKIKEIERKLVGILTRR